MLFRGKQAFDPPDVKRLPSPIVICNIRGIGDVLPAPKDFFYICFKAAHVVLATEKNYSFAFGVL